MKHLQIGAFWVFFGAVFGALAVLFGAFGAHALSGALDQKMLSVFQTGAHYHLIHAVALVFVGIWCVRLGLGSRGAPYARASGWAFLVGLVLFSGSLYLLAITGIRAFGAVTPVGGLSFLLGWVLLAVSALFPVS